MYSVIFLIILLSVATFALVRSSYHVVQSLSVIAKYFRISGFFLSFVLLAIATSMTELSVGINAALSGAPELSFGDILGTNIVNLTLILGIVTILGGGFLLQDYEQLRRIRLDIVALISLPFILLIDGELSRFDGLLLLAVFLIHIVRMAQNREELIEKATFKHSVTKYMSRLRTPKDKLVTNLTVFTLSITVLLGAAWLIVHTVTELSDIFGISNFIFGLFILAIGTSLPELAVGIRSIQSDSESMSIGNLFGAVIVNSTLTLGVISLIHPIQMNFNQQHLSAWVLSLLATIVIFASLKAKQQLNVKHGIALLLLYCLFVALQFLL